MKPAAIFLDFDGPLINWRSNIASATADLVIACMLRSICAQLQLNGIAVNIVVSSSHRLSGADHCKNILDNRCWPYPLWKYVEESRWRIEGDDWIPDGGSTGARAANIRKYCEAYGIENTDCVVIDDYDMRPYLPANMVQIMATPEGIHYPELQRLADWTNLFCRREKPTA